MGLPRVYGVMALHSDSWFGHSLERVAELLGSNPDILKKDPVQNIRGAAAYLRWLYDAQSVPEGTVRGSLESWQNAIALYCGIPQPELAQRHALEMLSLGPIQLAKGAVTGAPAVGDIVPTSFLLSQNFPKPFNPTTAISYQLPAPSRVQLRVFDVLGREVAGMVNEEKEAGSYRVTWDASSMPSGVYFYTLTTPRIPLIEENGSHKIGRNSAPGHAIPRR